MVELRHLRYFIAGQPRHPAMVKLLLPGCPADVHAQPRAGRGVPVSKISIRPWTVVDGFGSRRRNGLAALRRCTYEAFQRELGLGRMARRSRRRLGQAAAAR